MTLTVDPIRMAEKAKAEWEAIARVSVDTETISGAVYGFTSELGALRLFAKYNRLTNTGRARMGYSQTMRSWFFVMEF